MRPYGDVTRALQQAAQLGPAPARVLCERAQVGYGVGAYTCTRMVARGQLVRGEGWPALLALPPGGDGLGDALAELQARFWRGSQASASQDDGEAGGFACL